MIQRNGFTYPDIAAAIRSFTIYDDNAQIIYTPTVAEVRSWAIDAANEWAGEQRRQHFTDITAQDSVYLDKEAEARRCLADANPTAMTYPYTEIERSIIAAAYGACTLHQAAGFIVQVADEKRLASLAIEAKRRQVGTAISVASSVAEIQAALVGLMG